MANVKSKQGKTVKKKKTEREEAAQEARKQKSKVVNSTKKTVKEAYKKNTQEAKNNKDKAAKTSWSDVYDKTVTYGSTGKKNIKEANESFKKSVTPTAPVKKPKGNTSWSDVYSKTITYGKTGKKNQDLKALGKEFYSKNNNGGVDFKLGGKTVVSTAHKTDHSHEVTGKVSTGVHVDDDLGKAYTESTRLNKLGLVAEDKSIKLSDKDLDAQVKRAGRKAEYYKQKQQKELDESLTEQAKKAYKDYAEQNGYEYNKSDEQRWIDYFTSKDVEFDVPTGRGRNGKTTTKTRADIDKEIANEAQKYGQAYIESQAPTSLDYTELNAQEFDIMQTAAGMQGYITKRDKNGKVVKDKNGNPVKISKANAYMESQEKGLAEKVGSVNAASAYKGKAATGFLQGFSPVDVIHSGVGEYNNQAKAVLDLVTNSTGYNVGYGAGIMGQFMFGGVGTVGGGGIASLGESIGEAFAKRALTKGGEGLLGKLATASQKNMATKFLTNRAGELAVESPLNFADAVKMSTDADGNVDKDALVKFMGINSAMTFGMGGAIEGLGMGITKAQAKQFENLYGKWLAGNLTEEEATKMFALEEKLSEASNRIGLAKSRISDKSLYNAKVSQVLDLNRTPKETAQLLENTSIHSERMGYAQGLRDKALAEMEDLRTKRQELLADPVKNADAIKEIDAAMKEASKTADIAERQLQVEINRNKHTLKDLTKSLDTMEKATGIKYDVMTNDGMIELAKKYSKEQIGDDDFIKGFIYKDENGKTRIAINSESPQAHQTVIGHETGHFLKEVSPEEFDEISKMLVNYSKELGEYDSLAKQLRKCYPEATPKELQEELHCELLGRYVYGMDDKFIKRLASNKPTVLKKIVDYFKQLLGKSTDKDLAKELRAIVDKVESATKNVGGKKPEVTTEATPKFSKVGENSKALTDRQKGNLSLAKMMRDNGMSNDLIKRMSNGWYFGKDGLPRIEISDKGSTFNTDLFKKRGENGIRLKDVFKHDTIYEHYKELKNIPVVIDTSIPSGELKNGKLRLNPNRTDEQIRSTVIHEIQHQIQKIEGFTRGSSKKRWQNIRTEISEQIGSVLKDLDGAGVKLDMKEIDRLNLDSPTGVKDYIVGKVKSLHGETRANEVGEFIDDAEKIGYDLYGKIVGGDEWSLSRDANYYLTGGEAEARDTQKKIDWSQDDLNNAPAPPYSTSNRIIDPKDYVKYENMYSARQNEYNILGGEANEGRTTAEMGGKTVRGGVDENKQNVSNRGGALDKKGIQETPTSGKDKGLSKDTEVKFSKEKKPSKGGSFNGKKSVKYEDLATDDAHKKAGVSQQSVADMSKGDIGKEIGYLNARIRNGKTPASQALREERLVELYAEAEKRGMDIKNTPRKRATEASVLIKNKGVGYEEAKTLLDDIEKLKAKQSDLTAKINKGGDNVESLVKQKDEVVKELTKNRRRLDKVIAQSKTTYDESKGAYKDFKDRGLGNSSGHVDKTKLQAYKETLPEGENMTHDLWTSARRLFENSHVAFENQAKKVMKTDKKLGQDMLAQINNVIVARNIAAAWVQTARTNAKGAITGKSLNDVFKVKYKGEDVDLLRNDKMREDLSNYLYFKHAIAREKFDKDVFGADFTSADARAAMAELEDDYGKEFLERFGKDVSDYIEALNQFRIETGLISKAQLAELKKMYPDYVPTYRVDKNGVAPYDISNGARIDNGIKIAKGSDEPIEDLYLQLAKITDKTIKSGHQNKMVDMYAESMGLKPKDVPKDASVEDMAKSNIVGQQEKNGDWTISYYRDGEQVTIPADKQAAKGLREWNVQDKQAFIKLMSYGAKVTKPYKALITDLNLIFGLRNGARDAQQALVNSKDSYWYTKSMPAMASAVRHKDNAFRMLFDANGGKWSSIAQLSQLDDIAKLNKGGIKGTIDKGIEVIENINGAIEMMPRMAEFIGTIQKEADRILKAKDSSIKQFRQELEAELKKSNPSMGADEFSDLFEKEYADRIVKLINKEGGTDNIIALAMRNASDITVNFSRSGIITKGLNIGLVPYLNPSVQGLSKTMRMFSEGKANEALLNFMFKMTMLTTAPAVMNEILCADNEAYQSLNTRDKDANFFIPLSIFGGDKDTFIKFPKPRENSVLAEPFEYFARILMDRTEYGTIKKGEYLNASEIKQMFVSAQENVGIINIWEDNLISPIFKTMNNETWYGGAIESHADMYDENNNLKAPSERYDETTSPAAIWLGKWIGKGTEKAPQWKVVEKVGSLSPKKIDNLMDSYLGMIYDLGIAQTSVKQRTELKGDPLKRNPVFAQFLKDAVFSNKTSTQFWDKATQLNNKYGEKSQEYQSFMSKWGYDSFTYDNAIAEVDTMDKLTPKQKVQMKRELRGFKNQLMERALEDKPVKYDPMQRIINLYNRYGVEDATDKALSNFAYGDHKDAYEHLKSSKVYRDASPEDKAKWQQRFLNTYKDIKRIQRKTDGSDSFVDYSTAVYACVKNGYDKGHIANMYCWKQKDYAVEKMIERTKNYNEAGYTETNFVNTIRALNEGARNLKDDEKKYASELDDYDKAMILAQKGYRDGAFYITSPYLDKRMNAARCLTDGHPENKWTDRKISNFCKEYNITYEKGYVWDLDQVESAINDKYKNKSAEEKAAIFTVITGNTSENPFGEIGNYGHDNDSNLFDDEDKGKGGRGRGRRHGRRGGGGGSGKGMSWEEWLKKQGVGGSSTKSAKTKDNTSKSALNEAYRKRLQKNIKATRNK